MRRSWHNFGKVIFVGGKFVGVKFVVAWFSITQATSVQSKMPGRRSGRWVFTLNNYSNEEYEHCVETIQRDCKYGVVGRETGEAGTPHLQGFVLLNQSQRLSWLRNKFGNRYHWETARGTNEQARDYCKKEGDFAEFGEFTSQGKRTDLDELLSWMREFEEEHRRPPLSPDFAQSHPEAYLRYPRLVRLAEHRAHPVQLEFGEPRAWQRNLEEELLQEPDDRTVIFYVDPTGGSGKSWFQRWYVTEHPGTAQVLSIGKRDDLAHAIEVTNRVFFFNIPRGGMEFFQYVICENLKDRMVFSPKYNSRLKCFRQRVHVVVFCNEAPDETKMSADRYDIRNNYTNDD